MLLVPVASSDIAAAGYDPSSGELQIQFLRDLSVYSYQNITPDWYAGFIIAPSKGSYFAQTIRKFPNLYPYTKLGAMGATSQIPVPSQASILPEAINAENILNTIETFEGI